MTTAKKPIKVPKSLPPKKSHLVKGGDKPGRLASNHNLTLVSAA